MDETDLKKDSKRLRRLPKMSFNSKDLSRRMKRVETLSTRHARRFILKRWGSFKEVRRHISVWVLLIGVLVGAAAVQFWWYQNSYTTEAHEKNSTYAEALLGPVETLNPIFAASSAEEAAGKLLFSRLLTYDTTGKISFDLASSMKVSDDGTEYVVKMRPDARWTDGVYVRARDVVYTVNLVKNPATRSTISGWGGVLVSEVDDVTVKFKLPAAYAAFPHALQDLPILPEHLLRDISPAQMREDRFSSKPVGSGPFSLRLLQNVDVSKSRKIVHLARNSSYYKGEARLSRVQLHTYGDTDAIKRALATSEINAANDLSITAAKEASGGRYDFNMTPINSGVYALFNTASPILKDADVRRALQVGTDTSAVRAEIADGMKSLDLPFIPSQVSGELPVKPAFSVAEAAKILDAAGWKRQGGVREKDGVQLELSVVTVKNADFEKALKVLSSQWQGLGVAVNTEVVDPTDVTQNVSQNILQPRRYDVLIYQLSIGADPDVYAYWHSAGADDGYNFSKYSSVIADDALVSARGSTNPALRNAKYVTFAKQWLKDAPAVGLYQAMMPYVHSRHVQTDAIQTVLNTPLDRYNSVRYWSVGERRVFTTP